MRVHRRLTPWGLVALMTVLVLGCGSSVATAQSAPKIMIKIVKPGGKPDCTAAGSCELLVKDNRGLGVCKGNKADPENGQTYCWSTFSWEINAGASHLDQTKHKVVIRRSPLSTRGSEYCLDAEEYELEYDADPQKRWKATATVQSDNRCFDKSAWFYDAILLYESTEIDRKDPGVIIEN